MAFQLGDLCGPHDSSAFDSSLTLERLRTNDQTLCYLSMYDQAVGQPRPGSETGADFPDALVNMTSMDFNTLSDFADALASNTQVRKLVFLGFGGGGTAARFQQCVLIAKAIRYNSSIKVLGFVAVLRDDDQEAVMQMLEYSTIRKMYLGLRREFTSRHLVMRAFEAAKRNTSLISLSTSDETLAYWGAALFDDQLQMAFTEFQTSLQQIRDTFEANITLREFWLDIKSRPLLDAFQGTDCVELPEIKPIMQRNRSLLENWYAVSLLAHGSASRKLQEVVVAMGKRSFCKAVFSFFLPTCVKGRVRNLSEISSVLDVVQVVTHDDEPPAVVLEAEAIEIVAEQYAQHIAAQINHAQDGGTRDDEAMDDPIFMLTYAHHPAEFLQALMEGPPLQQCRDALAAAGHSSLLSESGAKVFVKPHQFQTVITQLQGKALRPYHVIVAGEFEHLIEESLLAIRSKKRPKLKACGRVTLPQPEAEHDVQETEERDGVEAEEVEALNITDRRPNDVFELLADGTLDVQRTFLCVVPRQRAVASVTQSTTSHYEDPVHGPRNPRRRDPMRLQP